MEWFFKISLGQIVQNEMLNPHSITMFRLQKKETGVLKLTLVHGVVQKKKRLGQSVQTKMMNPYYITMLRIQEKFKVSKLNLLQNRVSRDLTLSDLPI